MRGPTRGPGRGRPVIRASKYERATRGRPLRSVSNIQPRFSSHATWRRGSLKPVSVCSSTGNKKSCWRTIWTSMGRHQAIPPPSIEYGPETFFSPPMYSKTCVAVTRPPLQDTRQGDCMQTPVSRSTRPAPLMRTNALPTPARRLSHVGRLIHRRICFPVAVKPPAP